MAHVCNSHGYITLFQLNMKYMNNTCAGNFIHNRHRLYEQIIYLLDRILTTVSLQPYYLVHPMGFNEANGCDIFINLWALQN